MNEAQPDGTLPIHWAVYKVDYELIDALIAKKAKVDVTNEFGAAPLAEAVKLVDGRALVEVSGRMNLETIRAYAEGGPDVISVGALTHSAPVFDFGLDLES